MVATTLSWRARRARVDTGMAHKQHQLADERWCSGDVFDLIINVIEAKAISSLSGMKKRRRK